MTSITISTCVKNITNASQVFSTHFHQFVLGNMFHYFQMANLQNSEDKNSGELL